MSVKKKNIPVLLYIDDNIDDLVFFRDAFEDDYKIYLAKNRDEAFAILNKSEIQIVLTDYRLPGYNGIEILEEVYQKFPWMLRIIITAYREFNIIEQAVNKASIHGYLNKPLDIDEVKFVINNAYEKHFLKEVTKTLGDELKETVKDLEKEIQQRKQAEIISEYLRSILDNTNDHATIKDLQLRWIACNEVLVKLCGKKNMSELIGKTDLEIFGDYPHVRQYMEDERKAQTLKKGECIGRDELFIDKDGKIIYTHVRKFPVFDKNNNLIATANISRDITEKKIAEKKILKLNEELEAKVKLRTQELEEANLKLTNEINERKLAEHNLRMVQYSIDTSTTPTFWIDKKGLLIYSNKAACELLKAECKKNVSPYYYEISAYWPSYVWKEKFNEVKKKGSVEFEDFLRRSDGTNVVVEVTMSYVKFEGKEYLFAYANDISKRKKTESELQQLSLALEFSPAMVIITDIKGNIRYVNPKFTEITGYQKDEIIGKNPRILNAGKLPKKVYKNLWDTIISGKEWKAELCNKTKNGYIYWESVLISPVKNINNEITHYVAVKEDITERLKASEELKRAKKQAEVANKAKSEFLANMSHEIRTPMNAIMGFAELLSNSMTDELQKEYLGSILSSSKNLLTLINDILDLSKIEAGKLSLNYNYIDTYSFFSDIKAFFNLKLIEKNIDFIIDIDPSLPVSIYIDELRLRQILINLLGNAIKFTHKGYVKLFVKAKPKRKYTKNKSKEIIDLYIDVEDTGIGISSEFIDQIFDSFSQQEYQTSKKFGGTGLGLAISKRLIKMMNGTINVKSEINKGSIFSILLKNVQISRSKTFFKQEEITFQNNIKFKKSKIIIVDDVESNRKYLANALKNLEMEVYEADNGQVALTIIKKIIPDLVITDLKMPVIDGFQLLDEIKNKKELKHIPVIAISASFLEINNEKYKNAKFSSYLMKPLQLGILCRELSKYLPHELLEKGKQIKPVHQQKISKTDEIKILNTLEKDFYKTWEKFSRQQPIDEVEKFSKALIKVGKDYNINNIIEYGEKLLITINNFDIDFMLKLLNDFPILIKKFKHN